METNGISFSLEEFLGIVSKMLASKTDAQELITHIKENELTDKDDIASFITSTAKNKRAALLDAEFGKGRSKASKKTERLLQEFFPTLDFSGLEQEDIFQKIVDHNRSKKVNSKDISFEQAMKVPEVAQAFQKLQDKAANAEGIEKEFNTYKKTAQFLKYALPELEKMGAQFSKDPNRRKRQIEQLEQQARILNFKESESGELIFLDDEGNALINKDEARVWDSKEYLKYISPVDFSNPNDKPDKNIHSPSNKGGGAGDSFGYSAEQMKSFNYNDYKEAKNTNPAKAEFILRTMESNHINNK